MIKKKFFKARITFKNSAHFTLSTKKLRFLKSPHWSSLAENKFTKLCFKFSEIKILPSKIYLSNFSANPSQVSGRGGFGKSSASSGLLLPNEKRLFIHLCLTKRKRKQAMKHILIQARDAFLNLSLLIQRISRSLTKTSSAKTTAIDKSLNSLIN